MVWPGRCRSRRCSPLTRAPFTYRDDCVERDPHIGHDPAATEAAKQAVKEFFRQVFRME